MPSRPSHIVTNQAAEPTSPGVDDAPTPGPEVADVRDAVEPTDDETLVLARRGIVDRPVVLFLARVATIAAVLGLWELATTAGWTDEFFVSKPSAVWSALIDLVRSDDFFTHVRYTLTESGLGLFAGSIAGILFGFLFAKSRLLYKLFDPILSALYTLPRVALAPLFILWFGLGTSAKVALVISVVYFIMLLNTYAAITSVDQDLVDTMRLVGARRSLTYRRLYIPFSVPYLVAALRISLSFSIAAAIIGEMLVSQYGLGQLLRRRQDLLDTAGTFAVLVVVAVIAIVLNGVIKLIELVSTRWRPSSGHDVVRGSI